MSPDEFRKARPGFEAKIWRYAFLAKRAFSAMIDQPDVEWGRHPTRCAGTTAWLLPNPGGLNKAFTLDALVTAYGDLRTALLADPSPREC